MAYSFNLDKSDVVFALMSNINASYKDLCAVCDAIRYRSVGSAMKILDEVASGRVPVEYRRHNRYMGSRHELAGNKGRYPKKCAGIVMKVLSNAYANAKSKGYDPEYMHVIHASANKTLIAERAPPKGVRAVVSGGMGYSTMRRSNLEFARVEIGLSSKYEGKLGKKASNLVKMFSMQSKRAEQRESKRKPTAKDEKPSGKQAETARVVGKA